MHKPLGLLPSSSGGLTPNWGRRRVRRDVPRKCIVEAFVNHHMDFVTPVSEIGGHWRVLSRGLIDILMG
jgi:hypothetical protein